MCSRAEGQRLTPLPAWLLQFRPADRIALKRCFQDAVRRHGAATPAQVVMLVRLRYAGALALPEDAEAAAHYRLVLDTLETCRIDVRAWAREVIDREKRRRP